MNESLRFGWCQRCEEKRIVNESLICRDCWCNKMTDAERGMVIFKSLGAIGNN